MFDSSTSTTNTMEIELSPLLELPVHHPLNGKKVVLLQSGENDYSLGIS
jgi:hypothetical protein